MKVDLTNPNAKQGALDALRLILKSRKSPIVVNASDINNQNNGPSLQAPQNVIINDESQSQDEADQKAQQKQQQSQQSNAGQQQQDQSKQQQGKNGQNSSSSSQGRQSQEQNSQSQGSDKQGDQSQNSQSQNSSGSGENKPGEQKGSQQSGQQQSGSGGSGQQDDKQQNGQKQNSQQAGSSEGSQSDKPQSQNNQNQSQSSGGSDASKSTSDDKESDSKSGAGGASDKDNNKDDNKQSDGAGEGSDSKNNSDAKKNDSDKTSTGQNTDSDTQQSKQPGTDDLNQARSDYKRAEQGADTASEPTNNNSNNKSNTNSNSSTSQTSSNVNNNGHDYSSGAQAGELISDDNNTGNTTASQGKVDKIDSKKASDLYNDEKNQATLQGAKQDRWAKQTKQKAEMQAEKERKDILNQAAGKQKMLPGSDLETDLYYAIAQQVGLSHEMDDTYEHGEDPVYADSDFLMPQQDYTEQRTKPLLYVFVDQSSSFGAADVRRAKQVLGCLDDFVHDGVIMPPRIFVFANKCVELTDDNLEKRRDLGSSTQGFPECLEMIKESLDLPRDEICTNVLVLSDRDIGLIKPEYIPGYGYGSYGQSDPAEVQKVTIEGCVFWCWRGGSRANSIEPYLVGEQGNYSYSF